MLASACVMRVVVCTWPTPSMLAAPVPNALQGQKRNSSPTAMVRGNGTVVTKDTAELCVTMGLAWPTLAPLVHQRVPEAISFEPTSASVTVVPAELAEVLERSVRAVL